MAELEPDEGSVAPFAWWDASDTACFTGGVFPTAGDQTTFLDKSGNGKDLVASGAVALPLFRTSPNRLEFNVTATDTRLKCDSFFSGGGWSSLNTFSIIGVLRRRSTNGTATEVLWDGTAGHWIENLNRNLGGDGKSILNGYRTKVDQEYFVWGIRYDGTSTAPAPYISTLGDGNLIGGGTTRPAAPTSGNTLTFDRNGTSTIDLCEWIYYADPLPHEEFLSIGRGLVSKWGVTGPSTDHALIFLGNSTTQNLSTDGNAWPLLVTELLRADGYDPEYYNLGQSSGTYATLNSQKTMFESLVANCVSRGKKVVCILFHGHNDNGGATAGATGLDILQGYFTDVKTDFPNDVKTISISCTGTPTGISQANWEASRDWHRNNGLTYHDGIVDTSQFAYAAAYNTYSGANDTGNWWSDNVHFTDAGRIAHAAAVYPTVKEVLDMFAATGGNSFSSPLQGPFFLPAFSPLNPIISIAGG